MSLPEVESRWRLAPTNVLSHRHRLKMSRIDTCSIAAKMVEMHPLWDRSLDGLINHSVRPEPFPLDAHVSVARGRGRATPYPAAVSLIDELGEDRCQPIGRDFHLLTVHPGGVRPSIDHRLRNDLLRLLLRPRELGEEVGDRPDHRIGTIRALLAHIAVRGEGGEFVL